MNQFTPIAAVISAIFMFPVVPLMHIMLMRFSKRQKKLLFTFYPFVMYGILWLLLGFYINDFTPIATSSLIAGISMILFLCIGYTRFFYLVCNSISLRITLDVYSQGSLTLPRIIENYGGKGMDWLLKKRIEALQSLGMAEIDGDVIGVRSPLGTFFGKAGIIFKRVFKIGEGG